MTLYGFLEIGVTLALVVLAAYPLGLFMAEVLEGRRHVVAPALRSVERGFYRLAGIDPEAGQGWLEYAVAMLAFCAACLFSLYAVLRCQAFLPLNPQGFPGVPPDLAFNIAVSFITNTNWQAYAGETTLSPFTQMVGLTTHNFLDSAAATGMAAALIRGFSGHESQTVGNFWADVTRVTLYILLPVSIILALLFVFLGVPQTLTTSVTATTLEGGSQVIALGPVASQEAIKLIGDNGGGFFNANSAHPFENPSVWSNIVQNWCQLVLPVALVFAFGRMVGSLRQARVLLLTMGAIFCVGLLVFYWAETQGNPALTALGVDPTLGNLEGKDLRFGQAGAALFAAATTGTGTGASNAVLESMTPLGGFAAMSNLLFGCIAPGGVGTGLYSLLVLALLTAFLGGLMVGRTPEYLGKKIAAREMQLAILALMISPLLLLGLAGASVLLQSARDSLGAGGPHGLSEVLYAYASSVSDNGSAFAGLNANTPWYNLTTGIAMFLGRFAHVIPILAIAGALAKKKRTAPSAGMLPTDGGLFTLFLLAVVIIITLLQYLPALALGPLAEHFLYVQGKLF
ncbi:potassium-transporting ATPase subunit KdpA [Methylovirgula sp. 4M-Z18]|uniref:potassium-transporting ATPase subunit KdpA n=1 Tax=Methylovirgula sp. 4M-Z18 TaxID=2293567 RepID=UPI000E2F0A3D|nr:potassium-transporting ATPase subunit KdpA [Methylovirgula sp. 4M-Z18]RFB75057.1 potassium-transporting ATPase subunit KdpA [Methylovirgula sp. 4M-Z18]